MALDFKSPIFCGKIAIVCLGVVVLGLGLHSHFQSSWRKHPIPSFLDPSGSGNIKTFKICGIKNRYPLWRDEACPAIEMEEYFVSMIVICFIISLLNFIAGFFLDFQFYPLKLVDFGFHGTSAILLFIAGAVYIISAVQIDQLVYKDDYIKYMLNVLGYNFRKSEKIVAGVFTAMQALLYAVVAWLILRRDRL